MKEQTFYSRLYGRTPFGAEEIRDLFAVAADPRLMDYLLELSPYTVAQKNSDHAQPESVRKAAASTVIEAADTLRLVETSLENNAIDHVERDKILNEIKELELALATLKHAVKTREGA